MKRKAVQKKPRLTPTRHQWVLQWITARGVPLRQFVDETLAKIECFEETHYPRLRKRRPADQRSREDLVHVLVANLAHATVFPPPTGRLAIRGGNPAKGAGRYDNPAFGKGVRPLLDQMHEMGLLDFSLPKAMRGEVSSIAPTSWFAERVRELGITLDDFGRDQREEVLLLTRNIGTRAAPTKDRVEYKDTAETIALRNEVRKLNAFLVVANIEFVPDGLLPQVDAHERLLTRRFVLLKGDKGPRWDRGGRLFGDSFWLTLASWRRANIRIDGEPVADLDFSSMFARLAYAHLGVETPSGDLYAVPGMEGYRSGVKLAFNILLFDGKGQRKKWPEVMGIGLGDDADAKRDPNSRAAQRDGLLPAGWDDPKRLRDAILEKHPALRKAFGRGLGYGLMFTESQVLIGVLLELMRRGLVALPMHDGLLCAQSRKEEVAEVMRKKAIEITGAVLPVEEKPV
jgi:hypothetical protein